MKFPETIVAAMRLAALSSLLLLCVCTKKNVRVSLPEPSQVAAVEAPAPAPVPAPQPAVDTAALAAKQLREALRPLYFDLDRADLRQDALDRLQIIGAVLREQGTVAIAIEGHCDERGSSEYNMGLGENRAVVVKSWLTSYGIAESRIRTTSYGKERPAMTGCADEPCHQNNRRAELRVLSP